MNIRYSFVRNPFECIWNIGRSILGQINVPMQIETAYFLQEWENTLQLWPNTRAWYLIFTPPLKCSKWYDTEVVWSIKWATFIIALLFLQTQRLHLYGLVLVKVELFCFTKMGRRQSWVVWNNRVLWISSVITLVGQEVYDLRYAGV